MIGGVRREEGDRGEGETIAGGLDELGHFRFTVSSVKRGVCERGEGGGKERGRGRDGVSEGGGMCELMSSETSPSLCNPHRK